MDVASRRLRKLAALVAATFLTGWFIASATATQRAPANTAGIYIDFGNGDHASVVVPFDEPSISAIELLERSGLPILTVEFGALGDAVCTIVETGCDLSACRRTLCQEGDRNAPFWQFMSQGDDGNWSFSPLGGSTVPAESGDIHAWVWTGEEPQLPALTMDDLIAETGFNGSSSPAVHSTFEPADEDDDLTAVITGGAAIVITLAICGGLIVVQRRRHAAR